MPPPLASADATKRVSTAEAAKKFQFGGMAIKTDRLKSGGLKAPLRKSPLASSKPVNGASSADDEKKRRLEKVKLWKEQQRKLKQEEAQKFLAEDDAVPKQLTLWSPVDDEKRETPEERQQREEREALQRQRVQKVVEEVDPLDAYMAGLVDEAAIQQSIVNPAANVISLDEIENTAAPKINIYGTFLPQALPDESPSIDHESKSAAPVETPAEREAREERELQEFMRALKAQREMEATGAAGDAASTSTAAAATDDASSSKRNDTGRIYQGFEEDVIGETAEAVDTRSALEILQEAQKKKEIKPVDHSQVRPWRHVVCGWTIHALTNISVSVDRVHCVPEEVLRRAKGDQRHVGGRSRSDSNRGRDQDPRQELSAADQEVDAVRL